jgi:SRSO17 transposase
VDQEEYETAAALMVEAGELAAERRDELMGRVGAVFARREPFQQARKYVRGLLSDLPPKNGWTLAEAAGDRSPDKTQRLLNHASWDHHAAMGVVRDFVVEHLTDPHTGADPVGAVAVLDETGQEKKGTGTFAVKRQYVGCAGQVANAINVTALSARQA